MFKSKSFGESLNIKSSMTMEEKDWFQRLEQLMNDFPETLSDGEKRVDISNLFSPYRIETRDETGKVLKSVRVSKAEYQTWKRREKELKAQKAREDWEKAPILVKLMFWAVVLLPVVGIASCCLKG